MSYLTQIIHQTLPEPTETLPITPALPTTPSITLEQPSIATIQSLDNLYILDPNIALSDYLSEQDAQKFGLLYEGVPALPYKSVFGSGTIYSDALTAIAGEMMPLLKIIQIVDMDAEKKAWIKIKKIITKDEYNRLNSTGKLFYAPSSILYKDRWKTGDIVQYLKISAQTGISSPVVFNVKVPNLGTSSNRTDNDSYLLRLKDNSLLELYVDYKKYQTQTVSLEQQWENKTIDKILSYDPYVVKKLFLSKTIMLKYNRIVYDLYIIYTLLKKGESTPTEKDQIAITEDVLAEEKVTTVLGLYTGQKLKKSTIGISTTDNKRLRYANGMNLINLDIFKDYYKIEVIAKGDTLNYLADFLSGKYDKENGISPGPPTVLEEITV